MNAIVNYTKHGLLLVIQNKYGTKDKKYLYGTIFSHQVVLNNTFKSGEATLGDTIEVIMLLFI